METSAARARLREKRVIVTGGASGIGKASVERFAAEGADVAVADLNIDGARRVADSLGREHGIKAVAIAFDAGDALSCAAMVEESVAQLGGVEVLCNVAGIMDWDHLAHFSAERWDRMLRINLSGVFHACRHAMPHLIRTRGCIVNIASAAALVGIPYTTAYCAAKAGVVALTKSLAVEFAGAGVRVNAICPTGVKTPMHAGSPMPEGIDRELLMRNAPKLHGGELCEPDDVAAAMLFLASDDARYVSGIAMPVDGAQTAG